MKSFLLYRQLCCFAGISRDRWHKRRKTGGRMAQLRKKRKFELGRPPAMTKVSSSCNVLMILLDQFIYVYINV